MNIQTKRIIFLCTLLQLFCLPVLRSQSTDTADSLLEVENYEQAIVAYARIIQTHPRGVSLNLGNAYLRKGKSFFLLGKADSALIDYYHALAIFEQTKQAERLAAATSNIASAYFSLNDFSNADPFYKRSFEYSTGISDSTSQASILNDWAIMLHLKGETRRAIDLHLRAVKDFQLVISAEDLANNYLNLGICYMDMHPDSALYYFQQALLYTKDEQTMSIVSNNLGMLYKKSGKYEAAIEQFKKGLRTIVSSNEIQLPAYLYHNLGESYDSLRRYDSATRYYKQALDYNALLFNQQKNRFTAELAGKYESGKKDEKIKSQQIENSLKSRNLLLSLAGLFLAAVLGIVGFISYYRKKRSNQLLQLQFKQIEQLNKQLDNSNQVKATLFSVMSHDLRSPVSSIYSYLQLKKEQANHTEIIDQTEQLLETLEDLLIWSKSQLHQFDLHVSRVNILELFQQNINILHPHAQAGNITFLMTIAKETVLATDANMLNIIIRNLLSNAIKYARPSTPIAIRAKMDLTLDIVISNETVGRQEEPLQLFTSEKINSNKSGLGLTLVQDFTTKLNGHFSYSISHRTVMVQLNLPDLGTNAKLPS